MSDVSMRGGEGRRTGVVAVIASVGALVIALGTGSAGAIDDVRGCEPPRRPVIRGW